MFWIGGLLARVVVLDTPVLVVLAHGLTVFATAAFQHGNVRLPQWLDRSLQPVLVTIDMHRIHHSVAFEDANSNYGAVLSIWDRLFGTYTSLSPSQHQSLVFGLRELPRRDGLKALGDASHPLADFSCRSMD
jgi:sterol desaturase/sphingolipid hydroxylase (fatty acid hydroxylase superfamily)